MMTTMNSRIQAARRSTTFAHVAAVIPDNADLGKIRAAAVRAAAKGSPFAADMVALIDFLTA